MTHDELVSRVANLLTGHLAYECCHRTGGKVEAPSCDCREIARAAIAAVYEALKEPTDEMCAAGYAAPQAYGMADNREELARMRTQPAYTAMLAASPARGSE